jgi:hypothetical protein
LGGTYIRLNPSDVARLFMPQQSVEITIAKTTGDNNGQSEQLSFLASIEERNNEKMVLRFNENAAPYFNLFRTGKLITIHTGRSDGIFNFKSKILSRSQSNLKVTVETPKVLSSSDRRGGPRVPLTVPIVYRVLSFKDQQLSHLADKVGLGESLDLGKGGILLLTDLKLPVGMTLLIEFTLDDNPISLVGVVKRSSQNKLNNQFSVGIKFLEPGIEHQELIERAIGKSGELFKGKLSL